MNLKIHLVILLCIVVQGCTTDKKLTVVGHRGAMGYETENTLAAVEKALELGVDVVEIDVYKCRSGEIVVFHDENVDRLTNGEGFIEDMSIVQLKFLTVNDGHTIPMLQDVLKLVDKKCKLNIELKGKNTAKRVAFIVTYYIEKNGWKPEDFIISSFHEQELRDFYAITQDIPIAILTKEDPVKAIEMAKELHAVSINAYHETLNRDNVKTVQKAGLKLYAGVVNEPSDIEKMKALGVDGVFTDFPDRINR